VRTYLSSSKSKKTSLLPEDIVFVELSVIVTSYCFLIIRFPPPKSTDSIFFLGNGWKSALFKTPCELSCNLVDTIVRSLTVISALGSPPSQIPETVATPEIVNEFVNT